MHLFCEGKEKKRHKSIEKFEREELFSGETKKRLLKKTQEGEPQTLEKEDHQRAKGRAKSPSHILERTNHHLIMAPSKKGGKKESKTGAAVRVLDDDEEDKIQVLLLLLLVL
jgi:hypothetical protein